MLSTAVLHDLDRLMNVFLKTLYCMYSTCMHFHDSVLSSSLAIFR